MTVPGALDREEEPRLARAPAPEATRAVPAGLLWLGRAAVALVWLYQGLWLKVLRADPRHAAIVASALGAGAETARGALAAIGLAETALAVWVLWGWRPRLAALAQTVLLAAMNAGGILGGRAHLPDPAGMVLQNAAFLVLAWIVAEAHARK